MNEQDIKYLFKNNLPLYKEKVRSGEIPHEHHLHWDNSSETFNTEIESCCECDYVDFPRLNNAEEAIARVRKLADHFINCSDDCDCERCLEWPTAIIKALDGEQ